MNVEESAIERVVHRIERHIEEWHERMSLRETELRAHRERLGAEAAERERLLVQAVGGDGQPVAKEHRVVFVVHSEEAGKALEEFAREEARLVNLLPASGHGGAGTEGSWLVFE